MSDYKRGQRLILSSDVHGLNRGDVVEVLQVKNDGSIVARCPRASKNVTLDEDDVREE